MPTIAVLTAASVVAATALVARGGGSLGNREGTFDWLRPLEIPEWLAYLAGGLVLYVTLIPVAATLMVIGGGLRGRASESEGSSRWSRCHVGSLLLTVAFVSAAIDVDGTETLNERYVFYVVPLLFLGLGIWIQAGLPQPRPWSGIVVLGCCLLAVALPIDRLEYNSGFPGGGAPSWLRLPVTGLVLAGCIAVFGLLAGVLWLRCQRHVAGSSRLATAAWLAVLGVATVAQNASRPVYFAQAFEGRSATWIDDRVPGGSRVAVVLDQRGAPPGPYFEFYSLLVTEFFNGTVHDVYHVGPSTSTRTSYRCGVRRVHRTVAWSTTRGSSSTLGMSW